MIKYLILLLISTQASANTIIIGSDGKHIDVPTPEVRISGFIGNKNAAKFIAAVERQKKSPLILISIGSTGGKRVSGELMIDKLEKIKQKSFVVCVAVNEASSMAFNFLSHCDLRLATAKSLFLVHRSYYETKQFLKDYVDVPLNANTLRKIAQNLDTANLPFDKLNARLMGLSFADYDLFADNQTVWTSEDLLLLGYLQDIVRIERIK